MATLETPALQFTSLRAQVYDFLRQALAEGGLAPGDTIKLGDLSEQLGVSRTPLREALLQLEIEGFVTILPRRGIVVRRLDLPTIRNLYGIIGGLESAAVLSAAPQLAASHLATMQEHNLSMQAALDRDDFATYYRHNLALHDLPVTLTDNHELLRLITVHRQRLYDFPRRARFVKEWEERSVREHAEYLVLLRAGDVRAAADYLRDVHWSFAVQESFIRRYYGQECGEDP